MLNRGRTRARAHAIGEKRGGTFIFPLGFVERRGLNESESFGFLRVLQSQKWNRSAHWRFPLLGLCLFAKLYFFFTIGFANALSFFSIPRFFFSVIFFVLVFTPVCSLARNPRAGFRYYSAKKFVCRWMPRVNEFLHCFWYSRSVSRHSRWNPKSQRHRLTTAFLSCFESNYVRCVFIFCARFTKFPNG